MGACKAHTFSLIDASHVLPEDFFISEAGPSMFSAFFNEFFYCPSFGSLEKSLASDRVEIGDDSFFPKFLLPSDSFLPCVVFSLIVVSVVAADKVRLVTIDAPSQVLLDRLFGASVGFRSHE